MSNILSEISLHDIIYKLKDDNAVTQEQLEEALANVGNTSVVIQAEEPTDTSVIWIDPSDNSTDDFSPTITVTEIDGGHTVSVTDKNGTQTFNVMDGDNGNDGYTPVKGTDYFTEADKNEIINSVLAQIPTYDGSVS